MTSDNIFGWSETTFEVLAQKLGTCPEIPKGELVKSGIPLCP